MRAQLRHRVVFALEFFLRQQPMHVVMTRPAKTDHFAYGRAIELTFVPPVVMTSTRHKMMSRQSFFAIADRAATSHT